MGVMEPMTIVGAMSSTTLTFVSPLAVWAILIVPLAVAAAGILLAIPRPPRVSQGLHLVHPAVAH